MISSHKNSKRASAFTLIELLVVIAIIAILAAILFPVFAQAKVAAKKTAAISDMKQGVLASLMYQGDNDDSYMLSDSGSINGPGWGYGPPDTVPYQVMQPYMKNEQISVDPMDPWQSLVQRVNNQCPYMSPACTNYSNATPTQIAYAEGVRSNMGYNFAFFSPWIYKNVNNQEYVGSASINGSQVTQPAHTMMFGTSIWNRTGSGAPTGGGNWVVQTPCWNDANGNPLQPMSSYESYSGAGQVYDYTTGWDPTPTGAAVYGFLWPFYNITSTSAATGAQNGQVVIGWADGHAKSMPISQVAGGCSAYGTSALKGNVTNPSQFIWAINQ
jgi:prepilin-type N-terminal cleavage/methylation domain-containing protein